MPTSPRDLTDGKCRFLWENPPSCHRTSRADVGIGPYAVGETILSPTTAECFRGPLHTRRKRGHPLQAGEGWGCLRPEEGRYQVGSLCRPTPVPGCARSTLSQERVCPLTRQDLWPCHPLLRRGFFQAIYASRSESFLTIREVMRNSTATKAKKPHWALVVSEVAMKS